MWKGVFRNFEGYSLQFIPNFPSVRLLNTAQAVPNSLQVRGAMQFAVQRSEGRVAFRNVSEPWEVYPIRSFVQMHVILREQSSNLISESPEVQLWWNYMMRCEAFGCRRL